MRLKLTAVVVVVSVLPLAIVGYALINIKTDALKEANRELLFAIIRDVAHTLAASLDDTEDALASVGRAIANSENPMDLRVSVARELVGSAQSLSQVAIYDGRGETVDVIGEDAARALPKMLPDELLQKTLRDGRSVERPAIVAGAPHVLMVVPIKGAGATWFAATQASLEPIQTRVAQLASERLGGDLGSVFVIDNWFRTIAHPNRELSDTLTPMHDHGLLRDFEGGRLPSSISVFRVGVESRESDVRSSRESMAAVLISIDRLGWGIIAQLPTDLAFRSVTEMRKLVLTVLLAVIVLAIGAAVFLAHRLTEPIRALVSFAQDLAQRRFEKRVTIDTRDELSLLGNALSNAASELQESEREIIEQVEIRSSLGRYLPAQLVERIINHQQNLDLGGERREITVLFADVAGFTPLAESHAAEEVVTILNELFTILTEIVFRHEGTVDKFVGDCVMAFWGAPDSQPDHATRALRAAEDMLKFLEIGNEEWEKKFGVRIRLAIGVNSGDAVVGNFGSQTRMEYTAVGNVVNIASRLEAVARPQQIVVSESTKKAAGDDFEYLDLGEHALAGHKHEVRLFEVRI